MKNFFKLNQVTMTIVLFLIIGAFEVTKSEAAEQDVKLRSVVTIGGTQKQIANSITVDNSSNSIVAGVFNGGVDFDPSQASTIYNSTGTQDGFIAKYSSSEELIWARQIRTTTSTSSINVRKHAVDFEGNIVIIGEFKGTVDFDPSSNVNNMTANVELAGFFAKYSSFGDLIFAKKFDTTSTTDGTCHVYDLFIDPVGRIYMTGSATGSIDLDPGPAALTRIPRVWDDLWFTLVDRNGATITATILSASGSGVSKGKTITVDSDANVYVGVEFTGIFDADPSENATLLTSIFGDDVALLKFSNMSTLAYAKQFESSTGNLSLSDMIAVKNSNNETSIYLTGNFTSIFDLNPDNGSLIRSSQGSTDIFVGKFLASDGSLQQGFSIGGSGSDNSATLSYDSWQNSILVGGNFSSTVDFDPGSGARQIASNGDLDNFFASYSADDLSLNFAKSTGGSGKDQLTSIFYNVSTKKIGVAGSFQDSVNFNPDQATTRIVRTSQGIDNFWLSGFDHLIPAKIENDSIWGVRPFSFGVSAEVMNDGNNPVTERGFVYSKSADSLTVTLGTKVVLGSGTGVFGTNITNLNDSTTYYYRAYAKNDVGYSYSPINSVTTLHPFDIPTSITAVIPDTNKVSVRLNWSLPTNAIRSNKFYVIRKDFGINGDNTTAPFEVLAVVPRDTTIENYVFTDHGVNPHRKYTYDVVPTALVIIGEQPEDKVKPPTNYNLTRVIPTETDVVTATEVRDSVRNINFNWIISPKDSTTSKIYIEYGSGSNPSTFTVIDSIARTIYANGGTFRISKIHGQRIQDGIHTIRLRPATQFEPFSAGLSSTVTFNVDTVKYTSAPITSTCKDSVYTYTPTIKKTALGSVMHSIVNPPTGVSFNQATGAINWTPQANGIYNFRTIVTSAYNTAIRDTQQFSVTVTTCLPPQYYNIKCVNVTGGIITANSQNVANAKITAFRIDPQINPDMIMSYEAMIVNNAYSLHLPAGNYKLRFSGVNYQTKWHSNGTTINDAETVTTECNQNQVIDFQNVTGTSGTTNMTMSGRVTNSAGANLVASVKFIPVNSAGQTIGVPVEVTSFTNGNYNAIVPANEKYLVFCSAAGYNPQYFDKAPSIVQATTVDVNTQNKTAINFVLSPTVPTQYSMTGLIEDLSGLKLASTIIAHRIKDDKGVIIPSPEIYTTDTKEGLGAPGGWELENLKQGTYVVLVIPKDKKNVPGYANFQSMTAPRDWSEATEIPITTQQTTPIPTIRLETTDGIKGIHSWTGNIYSEASGLKFGRKQSEQPSSTITEPGVIIMLNDNNGKVVDYSISSNNGFVELTNLELGLFEYEASKVGFLQATGQIEVVENTDSTGQVVIQRHPLYNTNLSVQDMYSNSFIYPNPVVSTFQIHLNGAEGDAEVTILDYLGRIRIVQNYALNGDVFDATLSAKELEQGTYKVIVRSGRKTAVSSLIIRR